MEKRFETLSKLLEREGSYFKVEKERTYEFLEGLVPTKSVTETWDFHAGSSAGTP